MASGEGAADLGILMLAGMSRAGLNGLLRVRLRRTVRVLTNCRTVHAEHADDGADGDAARVEVSDRFDPLRREAVRTRRARNEMQIFAAFDVNVQVTSV